MKILKHILFVAILVFAPVSAPEALTVASLDKPLSVIPVPQEADWAIKWWKPRHAEKIAEKKAADKIDLVFLGDSITHAWDDKARDVWDRRYAPLGALNLGFSGDRTEHVLWRLQNGAIDDISPKVLVMMIGTNNAGHRKDSSADIALGVKTILDELERRLPNTRVLLLAIFPRGAGPNDENRLLTDGANRIISKYADGNRVHYLNINDAFLDAGGNLSIDIMKDLLHPNQEQYEVWADAIQIKLDELFAMVDRD